jgi:hypothetical protein
MRAERIAQDRPMALAKASVPFGPDLLFEAG